MTKELALKNNLALIPTATGNVAGGLDAYIARICSITVLSVQEEHDLAVRYREHDDLIAAQKLVLHNLRFVIQVARGYSGYGLPLADLIQEGSIGLMKAVKRFDPEVGVRLISFAVYWIRAEIHEFVLRNWRIVKIATTKAQRKLFFNLRNMKKRLAWLNQDEIKEVADQLKVKPEEVVEMESRMSGQDVGFDPAPEGEDEKDYIAPDRMLAHQGAGPEETVESSEWRTHQHQRLQQALKEVDDRSLDILKARWLSEKKSTLIELGKKYNVSAERIRQIENKAIKKLRVAIAE